MSAEFVSQELSGLAGEKGCAALWPCMPIDSATAYVRNGIALEAEVSNGGAKGRERPYGGKFMQRSGDRKWGPGTTGEPGKGLTQAASPSICPVLDPGGLSVSCIMGIHVLVDAAQNTNALFGRPNGGEVNLVSLASCALPIVNAASRPRSEGWLAPSVQHLFARNPRVMGTRTK
jgi:hypothetical protein